jgi:hypothetical protein
MVWSQKIFKTKRLWDFEIDNAFVLIANVIVNMTDQTTLLCDFVFLLR